MTKSASLVLRVLGALSVAAFASSASAGVYQTINVSGDPAQFDSVSAVATNPPDAGAPDIDPITLKITNDSSYLYLYIGYAQPINPQTDGLYLGIDSDNTVATGFNIYGGNVIGANAAFQNDFPFTQTASAFNSGGSLTSATATANNSGNLYLAAPFNTVTSYQMISLPLDLQETDGSAGGFNGSVFPQTFTLEFYTVPSAGNAVVLGPATYSLASASVPEPASIGLLAFGGLTLLRRRHRTAW